MSSYGERAAARFEAGYNCCQATFGAFCEVTGLSEDAAARLGSGLGAGYGRQREICGAVSGICMAAGLLYGYSDPAATEEKTETYALIRALCAAFREENGSLLCRELLGLEQAEASPVASPRTRAYYESRPCAALCRSAAELLAAEIERREKPAAEPEQETK